MLGSVNAREEEFGEEQSFYSARSNNVTISASVLISFGASFQTATPVLDKVTQRRVQLLTLYGGLLRVYHVFC